MLTKLTKKQGLEKLAEAEGVSVMEMLEAATFDAVVPGICLECGHTTDSIEPDSTEGYCECGRQSIQSCLILAGLI